VKVKKNAMTLRRLELFDERVKNYQKKNEVNWIKKREEDRLKLYEKTLSIERKSRLTHMMNMKKLFKLNEKDKKMEEIRNQRELFYQQKAKIEREFLLQKDDILNRVNKMMEQKREISPDYVRKMFPDDSELYDRVLKLKEKQKKGEEKIERKYGLYGTFLGGSNSMSLRKNYKNSNMINNVKEERSIDESSILKNSISLIKEEEKKKLEEEERNKKVEEEKKKKAEEERIKKEKKEIEIKNKVEEYKSNLQKEFDKLINEEKKKEEERVKNFEKEQNNELKLQLEKKISIERAQGTKKINEAKEAMDKKIENYELKLRKDI
jgi:hypothetical protein